MSKYRFNLSTVIIMLICILPIFTYGMDSSRLPQQIKIGIRHKETAAPLVYLFSLSGLELGYYTGNQFNRIESFIESDDIIVRKDGYFMNMNGTFIEYSFNEQRDSGNGNLHGPIHIQIGGKFNTRQEAAAYLENISRSITNAYIVYEDGWRVWQGLYTTAANGQIGLENIKTLLPQTSLSLITQDSKRIQVLNKAGKVLLMYNPGNADFYFQPILQKDGADRIRLDSKDFRGSMIVKRYGDSDLTVINQLSLDEYLYGVVPREVSGTWPLEAQKAQAVVARNYAATKMNLHREHGFDLCATTHCQVYGGSGTEHPSSTKAVNDTSGKVLTYNGTIVEAYYHSNSGGQTEDSENVWTNPLPYLRGVADPYSIGAPNDTWTYVITKQAARNALIAQGLDVGDIADIKVTEYSKNGRAIKLEISGTAGKKVLEKDKIRSAFGYNNIKSTYFSINGGANKGGELYVLGDLAQGVKKYENSSIHLLTGNGLKEIGSIESPVLFDGTTYNTTQKSSATSNDIIFNGKGWGHGIGMSQWGAKKMADEGFNYEQILNYYYTGTKVE